MSEKTVRVEYNLEGEFYTVRTKRYKDIKSLEQMRKKIMSVENAEWKWHCVLTFDKESLEYYFGKYGNVGKALERFKQKLRNKFKGFKYFYKYEEGRIGGRPHYHILFDFVNRTIVDKHKNVVKEWRDKPLNESRLLKLMFPKNYDKVNKNQLINAQRWASEMNKNKTDIEILLGLYLKNKWGSGITFARRIRNYMDLEFYVKKDFWKFTEAKYVKENMRKWGYSRNLRFAKGYKVRKEWEPIYNDMGRYSIPKAIEMVKSTKKNFIDYYNRKGLKGKYIFRRVLGDLKRGLVIQKKLI